MTHIGIAITTKDRFALLLRALRKHYAHLPVNVSLTLLVVDDGSWEPVLRQIEDVVDELPGFDANPLTVLRNDQSQGIARAKNQGIEYLMDAGCDHLFLFDDDAYPSASGWEQPYLRHPEGHLQHNWPESNHHDAPLVEIYWDDRTLAYHTSRGVMLYLTRRVVERVGGMDPGYRYGFEHVEFSERVHNAGLTTWAHQSPVTSSIVALDATDDLITSTIAPVDRRLHATDNLMLLQSHRGRSDFVPYRSTRNTVLTSLFTGVPDTQPGRRPWEPLAEIAYPLLRSLGHYHARTMPGAVPVTVLHNEPLTHGEIRREVEWTRVALSPALQSANSSLTVYVQRWVSYRQWLIAHPDVEKVWIVDCSDVEYKQSPQDPFAVIAPGTLYIGYEPDVCGQKWMRDHHEYSLRWLNEHPTNTLLNAGVLGGDRTTILLFISRLLTAYRQSVVESLKDQAGDMGFIQQAAHGMPVPVVHGPAITTVFHGNQHDAPGMWKHK